MFPSSSGGFEGDGGEGEDDIGAGDGEAIEGKSCELQYRRSAKLKRNTSEETQL